MSAPLQQFYNRQVSGMDDVSGPGSWAVRQWLQSRMGQRGNRCGEMPEQVFGHPVVDVGADEDISGDMDEIGAFDREVSRVEGEYDDDEIGAKDPKRNLARLREKKEKLEAKRNKAQQKAGAARLKAVRNLWMKRVEKLDGKIDEVESDIKAEKKRLQKLGLLAAGGAGAGAGAAGARQRSEIESEMNDDPDANGVIVPEEPVYPRVESIPDEQQQVAIPFLTGSLDVFSGTWAMGTTANTQRAISGLTSQINYAAFEVRGVQLIGYYQGLLVANSATAVTTLNSFEPPIKVTLQNLTVEGDINLLYGNNSFDLSGALGGAPQRTVINSLRSRPVLDRNSNAQLLGFMENPFAIPTLTGTVGPTPAVTVAVTIALLCKVRYDTKVRRGR